MVDDHCAVLQRLAEQVALLAHRHHQHHPHVVGGGRSNSSSIGGSGGFSPALVAQVSCMASRCASYCMYVLSLYLEQDVLDLSV